MSQFPVVQPVAQLPILNSDVMQAFVNVFDDAFNGFGGANFRRIKVRKLDFALCENGAQEVVPANGLYAVLVGAAPVNHCVWYSRVYAPGQEPEAPDLTWIQHTPDTFPDALPVEFRRKQNVNGQERWAFQICRRTVWCVARIVNGQLFLDTEKPYIFDLTSSSLFGKSIPEQNMYKWGGLRDVCRQYSTATFTCTPSMFLTQIVLDVNSPVQGVVMFKPMRDNNGNMLFLDESNLYQVQECAMRQSTQDLAVVREKLTYGDAPAQVQTPVQPTVSVTPAQSPKPAPVQASVQASVQAPVQTVEQAAPVLSGLMQEIQTVPPVAPSAPAPAQQPTISAEAFGNLLDAADSILGSVGGALNTPSATPEAMEAPVDAAAPEQPEPVQTAAPAGQPVTGMVSSTTQSTIANLMSQLG
jgi:hypothetical protein